MKAQAWVGRSLVEDPSAPPLTMADSDREHYIVEAYAPGRELTAAVLKDRQLAVNDFKLSGKLFDDREKDNSLEHTQAWSWLLAAVIAFRLLVESSNIAKRVRALASGSALRFNIKSKRFRPAAC